MIPPPRKAKTLALKKIRKYYRKTIYIKWHNIRFRVLL